MPAGQDRSRIDPVRLTRWYDFMARFYSLWRDDPSNPVLEAVVALLEQERRPLRILDAGCGTGLFALGLAQADSQWEVEGFDASGGMLAVAREKADRRGLGNVVFRQGDATRLPHEAGSFDVVVAAGLLVNLNDVGAALRGFRRVLRPGGRLLVVEFDRSEMPWMTKTFFRSMIFGQRAISTFARRFRFAPRWSLETGTLDPDRLQRELLAAGFTAPARTLHAAGQALLDARAGELEA